MTNSTFRLMLLLLGALLAQPVASNAEDALPGDGSFHALVRAFNEEQNRLAFGEADGLASIRTAMSRVKAWLKTATAESWGDQRDRNALVVFLLGGGSIAGAEQSIENAKLEDEQRASILAAFAYSGGKFEAAEYLQKIDPLKVEPVLGAHVALAQATLLIEVDYNRSFALLGLPSLLVPGSLIEEASLRRRILLVAAHPEIGSLDQSVQHYMRRFGRSVYREALVSALSNALVVREFRELQEVGAVVAALGQLPGDRSASILLRLAESQAGQGHLQLVRGFAEPVAAVSAEGSRDRARARLYTAIADLLADPPRVTLTDLNQLERQQFTPSEEVLLEAAKEVMRSVAEGETVDPKNESAGEENALVKKARTLMAESEQLLRRK